MTNLFNHMFTQFENNTEQLNSRCTNIKDVLILSKSINKELDDLNQTIKDYNTDFDSILNREHPSDNIIFSNDLINEINPDDLRKFIDIIPERNILLKEILKLEKYKADAFQQIETTENAAVKSKIDQEFLSYTINENENTFQDFSNFYNLLMALHSFQNENNRFVVDDSIILNFYKQDFYKPFFHEMQQYFGKGMNTLINNVVAQVYCFFILEEMVSKMPKKEPRYKRTVLSDDQVHSQFEHAIGTISSYIKMLNIR